MKVAGLISSVHDPASRFRIMQYEQYLNALGTKINCIVPYPPKDSDPSKFVFKSKTLWHICQLIGRSKILAQQNSYDLIWQNRLQLYDHFTIEKRIKKPFVFDLDDAIWLTEGKKQVDLAIKKAAIVFAGNEYLADYCSKINNNVQIIPSTIDTIIYKPLPLKNDSFVIGWIGTKSNFPYLELIKNVVTKFLEATKNTKLVIVSTEKPDQFNFDNERMIFKKWSAEKENELINEFSVGLMPLEDNEWTRGKCSYKMLQYMSCGKPVVASPVGLNKTILKRSAVGFGSVLETDWLSALRNLYNDVSLYKMYAENGRSFIKENYSVSNWALEINNHFKDILKK